MSRKPFYDEHEPLLGVFGCEEDKWSPMVTADGSFRIQPYGEFGGAINIDFGFVPSKPVKWYLAEDFLPCHTVEFESGALRVKIENLADIVSYSGVRFEAAYSRVTVENRSSVEISLPAMPNEVAVLRNDGDVIEPGDTVIRECAVFADRLGDDEAIYPCVDVLKRSGGFDVHYVRMKEYWTERLKGIVDLDLPDRELVNSYKAGFIYTHIIRDKADLWVGINQYHHTFSHDSIGIMQGLFTLGDMKNAKAYMEAFKDCKAHYPDGYWKMPWVYAVYLLKTGDLDYIRGAFGDITAWAHKIGEDFDTEMGIMGKSYAIDTYGYWTIDNEAAMMGLTAYAWMCEKLGGRDDEITWARELYTKILEGTNAHVANTQKERNISYIPMSPLLSNDQTSRCDPRDANWASMFLFGRWNWDGYLFGAPQYGILHDCVDDTYAWGINNRREVTDSPYCFGGYSHGFDCGAYNAGYGAAALRGERYRDMGIKAYQYMIENVQSAPYSFWEGITVDKNKERFWEKCPLTWGGGSSPHMWGQSTCTKVLVDSIVALKADGNLIIGRGIPTEWTEDGKEFSAKNFLASDGKRVDVTVKTEGKEITVEVTGEVAYTVELPVLVGKIKNAQGCEFDREKGIVCVPAGGKVAIEVE